MKKESTPVYEVLIDDELLHNRFDVISTKYTHLPRCVTHKERTAQIFDAILASQSPYISLVHGGDHTPVLITVSENFGMVTSPTVYFDGITRMNQIRDGEINEFQHMAGSSPVMFGVMDTAKAQSLIHALQKLKDNNYQFEIIFNNLMCKIFGVEESRVFRYASKLEPINGKSLFSADLLHRAKLWNIENRDRILKEFKK